MRWQGGLNRAATRTLQAAVGALSLSCYPLGTTTSDLRAQQIEVADEIVVTGSQVFALAMMMAPPPAPASPPPPPLPSGSSAALALRRRGEPQSLRLGELTDHTEGETVRISAGTATQVLIEQRVDTATHAVVTVTTSRPSR